MGDAVLCIPALRAIRNHFGSARITFLARPSIREVMSPCSFNDGWLDNQSKNPFCIAKLLRPCHFTHAVLFKNSFASAFAAWLAGIPARVGYAREGRSLFLTKKLHPLKLSDGRFKPVSMIDYYLQIASTQGAESTERAIELSVDRRAESSLAEKLPRLFETSGPMVVLVPGGAFGPSKWWRAERYAQVADWLVEQYGATVVLCVTTERVEKQIAEQIRSSSRHELLSLAENPLTVGELKALFARADLVVTNDTGPRHIAMALGRSLITLFGPNDPAWTQTGYENEIQIVGDAPCAPCQKAKCKMNEHLCMNAITVDMVRDAAEKLLEAPQRIRYDGAN
jgi:heptosyltransferase-2